MYCETALQTRPDLLKTVEHRRFGMEPHGSRHPPVLLQSFGREALVDSAQMIFLSCLTAWHSPYATVDLLASINIIQIILNHFFGLSFRKLSYWFRIDNGGRRENVKSLGSKWIHGRFTSTNASRPRPSCVRWPARKYSATSSPISNWHTTRFCLYDVGA